MALTEEQRERLAELRGKDIDLETEAQDARDARELEARELRLTLEGRGLKADVDFKIINNPLTGVFAVRKPDARGIRNWEQGTEKQKTNLEWMVGMLRHYIVEPDEKAMPEKGTLGPRGIEWARLCAQRPGLCWACASAFVELMGVDVEAVQRK